MNWVATISLARGLGRKLGEPIPESRRASWCLVPTVGEHALALQI